MIASLAAALLLAGLAPATHPALKEVVPVNSPVETQWGLNGLDYRPVEGGVEVSCTIHHRGLPTPGIALIFTLSDGAGATLATLRVTELKDLRDDRLSRVIALPAAAVATLKQIRAELGEYNPDGSRARLWSGAMTEAGSPR